MSDTSGLVHFLHDNPQIVLETSKYLNGVSEGLVKDLIGGAIGDGVKIWRWEKAAKNIHAARERLARAGILPQPVSPSIGLPLLEASSLEDREEILDLWIALLAAAQDPRRANRVRQSFIEVVRAMDPYDALLLSSIGPERSSNQRDDLARMLNLSVGDIDVSILNLIKLGCCHGSPNQMFPDGSYSHANLTSFGRELYKILS